MPSEAVREGILFAMGNPLLDIQADVDEEFLQKYDLKANDAILAEDKHKALYPELIEKYKVEYIPGGATQNTVRVMQWLIGIDNSAVFVGCIGKDDEYGRILTQKATEAGVNVKYQYTDKEQTGTCAVLVTAQSRSLVANLAAANLFTKSHLEEPQVKRLMENALYYYIAGYPLTVCPEGMLMVAKHAAENDKFFSFNLSAPFLCSVFKEQMEKLLPYVDVLFGNETEAAEFSKAQKYGLTDVKEMALRIARWPKENGKHGRIVIITQGADPTIVVKEGVATEYPVIPIHTENIVDTNGAGDAFVGGYLAQLVQGGTVEDCIRSGNYAANIIIQRSGCTLPGQPEFSVGVF